MKVNSITQQNFRGSLGDKIAEKIAKNPKTIGVIAGLAGCSVVAQKLVMSAGEATIGPVVDIGVGKAITAMTNEKDGRTNQSSKVQAARTFAQTIGGTITGIAIRVACITAATALCMKAGQKIGGKVADTLVTIKEKCPDSEKFIKINPQQDLYKYREHMEKWGKNIGGALATGVMMFTNFVIDAPLINKINKKVSPFFGVKQEEKQNTKEAK